MKAILFALIPLFILFAIGLAFSVSANEKYVAMYCFYGMLSTGFFSAMFLGKTTNVDLS